MRLTEVYDEEGNLLGILESDILTDDLDEIVKENKDDPNFDLNRLVDAINERGIEAERVYLEEYHYPI